MGRRKELHGFTVNQVHHALLDLKTQMDQTPLGLVLDEVDLFAKAYDLIKQAIDITKS